MRDCRLLFAVFGLAACNAFLQTGYVEERPNGRALVLPAQSGQHEARGFTKTLEARFLRLKTAPVVVLAIELKPHVRAVESYMPTPCDRVVISRTDTDGVEAPVRHEDRGGGHEMFVAQYSVSDLEPFTTDDAVRITLCDYEYRLGGRGLAALLH